MTRRACCLSLVSLAGALAADPENDARERIMVAARALADGSVPVFLDCFDRTAANYQALRTNVTGLVAEAELQCSVDVLSNEGNAQARTIELDWLLRITPRGGFGDPVERNSRVTSKVAKQGRRWRIVAFEPVSLLAPLPARPAG
jgi:hypothetical protein